MYNSLTLFLICFVFGFGLGVLYSVLQFFKLVVRKNIIISNVFNFLFALFYGFIILMVVINLNFGNFRLFVFIAFLLGTVLQQKTLEKIFAKMNFWLYNKLCKGLNFLKNTRVIKKVIKWIRIKQLKLLV